jgi:hypothetical protein
MDSIFQQAIELSNAGAMLLQNNENPASLAVISQAMVLMRDSGAAVANASCGCSTATVTGHSDTTEIHSGRFEPEKIYGNPVTSDSSIGDGFYVYDTPLRIPTSLCAAQGPSFKGNNRAYVVHRMISTVLLFNMALAHHQHCKMTSAPGSSLFAHHRNAIAKLYDILLTLLDDTMTAGVENHNDMSFWIVCKCLVLNNRSNLYYEDFEYAKCQVCLEELLTLAYGSESHLLESNLGQQVAAEIYLNVIHPRSMLVTALAA